MVQPSMLHAWAAFGGPQQSQSAVLVIVKEHVCRFDFTNYFCVAQIRTHSILAMVKITNTALLLIVVFLVLYTSQDDRCTYRPHTVG